MTDDTTTAQDVLDSVRERYAKGAQERVPELCCPVDYDASLLEVLPEEIVERDYGCGDPSRFVRPGDTVLDLCGGSGSTLIAAEKTRRHARLMELDPKYADVICKRYQELTGKPAVLAATGALYADLANASEVNDG